EDRERLGQGMKGLAVRVAKGLNELLGIRGQVWADRYHARALKTPREVRSALIYVLRNRAKHNGGAFGALIDRCSSAPYFDGWEDEIKARMGPHEVGCPRSPDSPNDLPVASAHTWLMTAGWRRSQGPLRADELPSMG